MRILIFNWKDISHPTSGGAEIATHELAKRWVKEGNSVTILSSMYPNALSKETLDDVKIIRKGKPTTTHFIWAFWLYQKVFKGRSDVIIDQIHGVPFFTLFYVNKPKVALIFEVAKDKWLLELPFPLNITGLLAEKVYLRLYRNIPFLTCSQSTREDLKRERIGNVFIFPLGSNIIPPEKAYPKENQPAFISLGRILPGKQLEQTIEAIFELNKKGKTATLWIVGKGEPRYTRKLKQKVHNLNLDRKVIFWGFVKEKKKIELLQRSWSIISTSAREGWGLNIIEAGVLGTPAIVYNSPGLTDAVIDNQTGLICKQNTPTSLSSRLEEIIDNPKQLKKLSANTARWNKQYDWDKSAKITLDVLKRLTLQRSNSRKPR